MFILGPTLTTQIAIGAMNVMLATDLTQDPSLSKFA